MIEKITHTKEGKERFLQMITPLEIKGTELDIRKVDDANDIISINNSHIGEYILDCDNVSITLEFLIRIREYSKTKKIRILPYRISIYSCIEYPKYSLLYSNISNIIDIDYLKILRDCFPELNRSFKQIILSIGNDLAKLLSNNCKNMDNIGFYFVGYDPLAKRNFKPIENVESEMKEE